MLPTLSEMLSENRCMTERENHASVFREEGLHISGCFMKKTLNGMKTFQLSLPKENKAQPRSMWKRKIRIGETKAYVSIVLAKFPAEIGGQTGQTKAQFNDFLKHLGTPSPMWWGPTVTAGSFTISQVQDSTSSSGACVSISS